MMTELCRCSCIECTGRPKPTGDGTQCTDKMEETSHCYPNTHQWADEITDAPTAAAATPSPPANNQNLLGSTLAVSVHLQTNVQPRESVNQNTMQLRLVSTATTTTQPNDSNDAPTSPTNTNHVMLPTNAATNATSVHTLSVLDNKHRHTTNNNCFVLLRSLQTVVQYSG